MLISQETDVVSSAKLSDKVEKLAEPDKAKIWFKALTLSERAVLAATLNGQADVSVSESEVERLLQRWRSQYAFKNDEFFKLRLAEDGLTEAEFGRLLAAPIETLSNRLNDTPDWINEIHQSLGLPTIKDNEHFLPISSDLVYPELAAFLEIAKPFIYLHRRRLQQRIRNLAERYHNLPFNLNSIEEIVLEGLDRPLIELLTPTLVLELNVARLKGLLRGDTSAERFNYFISLLSTDYARTIFEEYPVLVRQLNTIIRNWIAYAIEILEHLCQDLPQIASTFGNNKSSGQLSRLKPGKGDFHRQGRSVTMVEFTDGLQLVYKPRSLALDCHFQHLLTWVNQRGWTPAFQTLKVLDRNDYGWVEYIEAAPCSSTEEVERFYQRQGGYLALLYMLAANDFHAENIIAKGEQPFLIDLETLFQPDFNRPDSDKISSSDIVNYNRAHSVLKIGLLPQKIFSGKNFEGLEASGLGGEDGQMLPRPIAHWEKAGTDEMHVVLKSATFQSAKNRPTLNGLKVNAYDYVDAIIEGFSNLYNLLIQHRAELLAVDGPLQKFENAEIRILLRPTYFYALLRQHSLQPNYLRDGRERDRLLDKLWTGVKVKHWLVRTVSAERKDIQEGDIPFFTGRVASHHVYTSRAEIIPEFLNESGMEFVCHRVEQLSESDLNRQLWYIRAALTTFARRGESHQSRVYRVEDFENVPLASPADYLNAACQLGDRILELALQNETEVTWLSLIQDNFDQWSLGPLGLPLYDGLPGVALFLAYLGQLSGQEKYTACARAVCESMRQLIAPSWSKLKPIGVFEGWSGVIYCLMQLGLLWDRPDLLVEAVELVESLSTFIEEDENFDLISGLAGCLAVLVKLYKVWPQNSVLTAALRCGERLLEAAKVQERGLAWLTPMPVSQPAVGLGRGSTGIGLALLQLAELTSDERFRQAGLGALAYERSVFQPDAGNWPDFRTAHKDKLAPGVYRYSTAWCHGAPGVGLARLATLDYLDNQEIRAEIEIALLNTIKRGFGANHSLCHGDMGNIDLLVEATQKLDDPRWQNELNRIGTAILKSIHQYGWRCSTPLDVETSGLMVGLAGIGYGLLRLINPKVVPSVLSVGLPSHQHPAN